jgi:hypothetical protein
MNTEIIELIEKIKSQTDARLSDLYIAQLETNNKIVDILQIIENLQYEIDKK